MWTVDVGGEILGKEMVGRYRKILQNLAIASVEKVSS
jgi:hypothetical protein